MNKLEYKNSGGFPLTTNRLDDIQETFALPINGLAAMAGNLAIISGCAEVGNTITDGFIFVENEIFEFRNGIKQTYITLFEDKIEKGFENGHQKIVNTKRYFTFGTGSNNYRWSDFRRVPPLVSISDKSEKSEVDKLIERVNKLEKQNAVFQAGGGMVLWNKPANEIPVGWREVVDWRGRIPAGFNPNDADFSPLGKLTGNKTHTLTVDNLPNQELDGWVGNKWDGWPKNADKYATSNMLGTDPTFPRQSKRLRLGQSVPFSLLPPVRVVMFIEFVG